MGALIFSSGPLGLRTLVLFEPKHVCLNLYDRFPLIFHHIRQLFKGLDSGMIFRVLHPTCTFIQCGKGPQLSVSDRTASLRPCRP